MLFDVPQINNGYLTTPVHYDSLRMYCTPDDTHDDHYTGWPDYTYWSCEVYPPWLNDLANTGIPFLWEFTITEDFSYFAYNFPTDDQANCLKSFRTGKRKRLPHVSVKLRKELEVLNATNTLLLQLGFKHGSNQT